MSNNIAQYPVKQSFNSDIDRWDRTDKEPIYDEISSHKGMLPLKKYSKYLTKKV